MKPLFIGFAVGALTLSACGTVSPSSSARGLIVGTVVGWPASSVGGSTRPAADASVIFTTDQSTDGRFVVKTGSDGSYHASLPAGRFGVRVNAFGQDGVVILRVNGRDTKTDPAVYVDVSTDQQTQLNLEVATGIE